MNLLEILIKCGNEINDMSQILNEMKEKGLLNDKDIATLNSKGIGVEVNELSLSNEQGKEDIELDGRD